MNRIQVAFESNQTFNCRYCLAPLIVYNSVTHYAEIQGKGGEELELFIVDRSEIVERRIIIDDELINVNGNKFYKHPFKVKVYCKDCFKEVGFFFKVVTLKDQDLLKKYLFKVQCLQMTETVNMILKEVRMGFESFIEESLKQEKQNRQKRDKELEELRKRILQIDPSIKIRSGQKIEFTAEEKPVFRLLPEVGSQMLQPQSLLLRKQFVVIKINREQCLWEQAPQTLNSNQQTSILKQQSCPNQSKCLSHQKSKEGFPPRIMVLGQKKQLKLFPLANYSAFFPLLERIKQHSSYEQRIIFKLLAKARHIKTTSHNRLDELKQQKKMIQEQLNKVDELKSSCFSNLDTATSTV